MSITIGENLLPAPAYVDEGDESVVLQSPRNRIARTHEPDPQVQPRSFTLHYQGAHGAVADAIRRHFKEHGHSSFDWTPPGAPDALRVMHAAPPNIAWGSFCGADCQVFLEEV